MAKRIITTILQNYCGRYLDGITSDNIEASVWSGEVSLKNLAFKPGALDFLGLPLPVIIRKGHVGSLEAVVPYTALSSQSTTITIQDVFVTVVPRPHAHPHNYDYEAFKKELEESWAIKLNRIDLADILRQGMKTASQPSPTDLGDDEGPGFFDGLVATIVENLVVTVQRIHVRFEDRLSHPSNPFSVGLVVHDISLYTTDAAGKKIFVDAVHKVDERDKATDRRFSTHKRAHVEGFALYWSSGARFKSLASLSASRWKTAMREIFSASESTPVEDFLIRPMDTYVRFVRHRTADDLSMYEATMNLDRLGICGSTRQYRDLLAVCHNIRQVDIRRASFRMAFAQEQGARPTLAKDAAQDRYVELYGKSQLSAAERRERVSLERDILSIPDIMALRDQADALRPVPVPAEEENDGYGFGDFVDALFGTVAYDDSPTDPPPAPVVAATNLPPPLPEYTGAAPASPPILVPSVKIGFSLYDGTGLIFGDKDDDVLAKVCFGGEMQFDMFQAADSRRRLEVSAWEWKTELLTFEVWDRGVATDKIVFFEEKEAVANAGTQSPLRRSAHGPPPKAHPVVALAVTSRRIRAVPPAELVIQLTVAPLTLAYRPTFVDRLGAFQRRFPRDAAIEQAAMETLEEWSAWAGQGVAELLQTEQTVFRARCTISRPRVILPVHTDHDLCLTLGHVNAKYGPEDGTTATLLQVSLGHLEIDDTKHMGTTFQKLATSSSSNIADDLVHVVCTVDDRTHTMRTAVQFEELRLQWNADTYKLLVRQFTAAPGSEEEALAQVQAAIANASSPAVDPASGGTTLPKWISSVHVQMKELSLTLNKETISRHVVQFQMIDAVIHYEMDGAGAYVVKGSLGNLRAVDLCTAGSQHVEIMGIGTVGDQSLLRFTYEAGLAQPIVLSSVEPALHVGTSLAIGVTAMRIVYVHSLIMELNDYVFQAMIDILPRANPAQEPAPNVLASLHVIGISVTLERIALVLPPNALDTPAFQLTVPRINVVGEYDHLPVPRGDRRRDTDGLVDGDAIVPTRVLHVSVTDLNVLNSRGEGMLNRASLSVEIMQPLLDAFAIEALHEHAQHLYVHCHVPKLKATVTSDDVAQLVRLVFENFGQTPETLAPTGTAPVSPNAVQFYYGQTEIVFPYYQGYDVVFDFIALNLAQTDNRETLLGLFLLETARYRYTVAKAQAVQAFRAESLQAINCWPYTILDMVSFFSADEDGDSVPETLVATAPFTLHNLLPTCLHVQQQRSGKILEKTTVATGESCPIVFDATLFLRVDGCRWSRGFLFEPGVEHEIALPLATSATALSIDVDVRMDVDRVDVRTKFWVVNHTGLDLQFHSGASVLPMVPSPALEGQDPLSEHPRMLAKKVDAPVQVRVNDGNCPWSKPNDCDRAGTHHAVHWDPRHATPYDIYCQVDNGPYLNRLGLTRIIQLHPKFLILNETGDDLFAAQRGMQDRTRCPPKCPTPFYFGAGERRLAFAADHTSVPTAVDVSQPCRTICEGLKITIDYRGAHQLLVSVARATDAERLVAAGEPPPALHTDEWELMVSPGHARAAATAAAGAEPYEAAQRYVSTLDMSVGRVFVHLLNENQRVVTATLDETRVLQHRTPRTMSLRVSSKEWTVEDKIKKAYVFSSKPGQAFLTLNLKTVADDTYTSHVEHARFDLAPIMVNTSEAFLGYIQHYFMRSDRPAHPPVPLAQYVDDLTRAYYPDSSVDRTYVRRLSTSQVHLFLTFERKYNSTLDHKLSKAGGVPLIDVLGIKTSFNVMQAPITIDPINVFNLEGSGESLRSYLLSILTTSVLKSVSVPLLLAHTNVVENFVRDKVVDFFGEVGKLVLPDNKSRFVVTEVAIAGPGKLGVEIRPKYSGNLGALVNAVTTGLLGRSGQVRVGDHITRINHLNVRKMNFKSIVNMLQTRGDRRMVLEITRPEEG